MEDLIEVFGSDFLSYVLSRDVAQTSLADLSPEQLGIVGLLRPIADSARSANPFHRSVGLAGIAVRYDDQHSTTFANVCRRHCGGPMPTIEDTADDLRDLLLRMGLDIYPAFLLPQPDEPGIFPPNISGAFAHPLHREICKAILADTKLRDLFPEVAAHLDLSEIETFLSVHSYQLIWESGRSGGVQLALLAGLLMISAYHRCLLERKLEVECFLSQLATMLNDLRKLASGESCDVSIIFSFSNITLPPDTLAEIPWGRLRSPEGFRSNLLPRVSDVGAVLVAKRPLRILHIDRSEPPLEGADSLAVFERFRSQMQKWATETDRISELTRFAFLLASPSEGFYTVRTVSRTHVGPMELSVGTGWASMAVPFAPSPRAGLGPDALKRVIEWSGWVKDHPKALDIAMRRTLTAVTERTDPIDGFIDAVLAWENLFSGYPETNLRVCGAIAWLLESDHYERRNALFRELKNLYAKRSSLVHGASDSLPDAVQSRNRAVRIAVDSIRRLYEYKHLLSLKDSAERGGMIVMGAANSAPTIPPADTANGDAGTDD